MQFSCYEGVNDGTAFRAGSAEGQPWLETGCDGGGRRLVPPCSTPLSREHMVFTGLLETIIKVVKNHLSPCRNSRL